MYPTKTERKRSTEENVPDKQNGQLNAALTLKILYVDDDENGLYVMRQDFERYKRQSKRGREASQVEFLFADNIREAYEIVESTPELDVVITDIVMPSGSGIELLGWIKERRELVKVVLSAYPVETYESSLEAQGGCEAKIIKGPSIDLRRLVEISWNLVNDEKGENGHESGGQTEVGSETEALDGRQNTNSTGNVNRREEEVKLILRQTNINERLAYFMYWLRFVAQNYPGTRTNEFTAYANLCNLAKGRSVPLDKAIEVAESFSFPDNPQSIKRAERAGRGDSGNMETRAKAGDIDKASDRILPVKELIENTTAQDRALQLVFWVYSLASTFESTCEVELSMYEKACEAHLKSGPNERPPYALWRKSRRGQSSSDYYRYAYFRYYDSESRPHLISFGTAKKGVTYDPVEISIVLGDETSQAKW